MNIQKFKDKIKTKDVEGNMTYLYLTVRGCRYGQCYQNQTSTIDDMKNRFVMTYYPIMIEDNINKSEDETIPMTNYHRCQVAGTMPSWH